MADEDTKTQDREKLIQKCQAAASARLVILVEKDFREAYETFEKMYALWLKEETREDPLKFKYPISFKVILRPGTGGDRNVSASIGFGTKITDETAEEEVSIRPRLPGME